MSERERIGTFDTRQKCKEKNAWAIYERSPQRKALAYVNLCIKQAKHQSENLFSSFHGVAGHVSVCVYGEAYVYQMTKSIDSTIAFNTQHKNILLNPIKLSSEK